MTGILTAICVILIFGLIIFIHEFGHFITAKLFGVTVHEFAIGMGPKLVGKQWGETFYSLRLIPMGGYVKMEYVDAMMERERIATTYLDMGIAIPHGTESAKKQVLRSGITVVQYPEGVDFDGEKAYLVIGIAGVGDQHLELLARVSEALEDEDILAKLKTTTDPEEIYKVLNA